jgi:hypothetical protein
MNVTSLDEMLRKSEENTGHSDPNATQCSIRVKRYVLLNLKLMVFIVVPCHLPLYLAIYRCTLPFTAILYHLPL